MRNCWLVSTLMLAACGGGGSTTVGWASIESLNGATVTGDAYFNEAGAGSVNVAVTIYGCDDGKAYPVHIHTGSACTDATTQGGHWDMTRGEGIPAVTCTGSMGMVTYNRAGTDRSLAWSVDGDNATDVIGHTVVVHDPDMPMTRVACGAIQITHAL